MTRSFCLIAILFLCTGTFAQKRLPYKDLSLSVDERVSDLLGRMTPEEKFFQLFMVPATRVVGSSEGDKEIYKHGIFGFQVSASSQGGSEAFQMLNYNTTESGKSLLRKINSIQKFFVEKTRLGIPIIAFDESLHGLMREGATSFPQSIGLAATFDTTLMREVAQAIAQETKARGIRQILSPVINIASDVRWGRVEETYGEDPFLTSAMAVAYVKAFEKLSIITTPKHLIANVGDGGRDSYPIHLNERYLEEIHFPPFINCFKHGGTRSVMTSYNSYDGVPCSANDWILNKKVKTDWGFSGFVISDANATGGSTVLHHTAANFPEAAKQAIDGGLDVIFQTEFEHHKLFLQSLLNDKRNQQRIDDAVARVLRAKFQLGLFERPYMPEDFLEKLKIDSHKALAKRAALNSIVLLRNEEKTLPLGKGITTIAVIGEDAVEARLGGYSGPGNSKVNILDGIRKRAKNIKVTYAEGCKRVSKEWEVIEPAYLFNDGKEGLKAEYFNNVTLSGSPTVTKGVEKVDFLWTLSSPDRAIENDFYSCRWTGKIKSPKTGSFKIGLDGNDGFRLYMNDKLVIDRWKKETFTTALVNYDFEVGKEYAIRVEFFEPVGNARIKLIWNVTMDDHSERSIAEAVNITKQSDIAIVVAGIHEGEFQDRAMLSLPGRQEELIRRIAQTGKPVVIVLIGGSAITMSNWISEVDAVVDAWYPGEEGGNAVAEVLFGDYNPAGRLPVTFPVHEAQLPLVYNHKPTGRGDDYYNLTGLPLFPFGFGLSYTTYEYSSISFRQKEIESTGETLVTFRVTNTGDIAGDEVCQLYIRDVLASVAQPVMQLKAFQRIHLKPGESKEVKFQITPSMLQMLNKDMKWVVEPGDFKIMIGSSSRDIRLIDILRVR